MLLTLDQLREVRQIVEDHHHAFVANVIDLAAVAPDIVKRLKAKGMIAPEVESIKDSYLYGQLVASLESAKVAKMSYGEFKKYLARNPIPLSAAEHHAVQMAQMSAAQYCAGLGNRVNLDTGAVLIEADAKLRARMVEEITDATAQNIARRQSVKSLKTDLGWIAKDWARDWTRIAVTEKQNAMQHGQADSYRKQYGDDVLVAKRVLAGACQHCMRVYNDPNGQPRIFKLSTLEANGTNVGRKAADYRATLGPLHPFCVCATVRIPAGWGFDAKGDLVPDGKLGYVYDDEGDLMLAMREEATLRKAFKLQGHIEYQGLSIAVENRKGSTRKWKDADGNTGKTKMQVAYGYLKRTRGADGDEIDCFVGPDPRAENVYVVEQLNPATDIYDESKAMIGFGSQDLAVACYREHYDKPDKFILTVSPMKMDQFKRWIGVTMPVKADGLQKGLRLVIPLEKAGPFIGPRGGKWADLKHTIPWKEPKKIRTGLISIPEKKIREVADELLSEIIVDGRGQVRKMSSNYETTTLTTPTGDAIHISVTFLPTDEDQGLRGVNGNARTEMRWNKDGSAELTGVVIRIKAKKMVWDRKELGERVRSVLDHEMTHAVDLTIIKKLRRKAMSIASGKKTSADKPISELTDKEYINKPVEVTARMRQIARDILDKKSVEEILDSVKTHNESPKTMPGPYKPSEVVAWSPTWQFIKDHLTEKNRKRVLKMAASLVEGIKAGKLEPIEKALMETGLTKARVPDYIGAAASPAGNRAPGPGIGANYIFLPRPKRDKNKTRLAPGVAEVVEERVV
ncbi:MAG: hypothetical protein KAT58_08610, partial [candidate division Zixibacteria bacterium]|nr:hypothetical protein [candidate division Zixibacteria bacterium]